MFHRISANVARVGGPFAAALYAAAAVAIFAWGAIGAAGWWFALSDAFTRAAVIALHCASVVFASCGIKLAFSALGRSLRHGAVLAVLGIVSIAVTGYGGHQGLLLFEQRLWSRHDLYAASLPVLRAAEDRLAAVTAEIDALPAVPLTYPDGRPIGVNTREILNAERARTLDRLVQSESEARIAVAAATLTPVPAPGVRMTEATRLIFTVVAELIETLAFWGISLAATACSGRDTVSGDGGLRGTGPSRRPRRALGRGARRAPVAAGAAIVDGVDHHPIVTVGQSALAELSQGLGQGANGTPGPDEALARAIALKTMNPALSLRAIEQATGVAKSTLQRYLKRIRAVASA